MIKPSNSNFNVHPTFNSAKQSAQMEFHAIAPMYIAYGTIFLVSLFGNSFIIHIIRTDKSMKTAIYYLISNQASVDILITFIYLMDTVRVNSYQGWWFGGNMGNFTCKLCHASFYFLPSFSLFLLVAIAVDRFYAVTRPFDRTPIFRHVKKSNFDIMDFLTHSFGTGFCKRASRDQKGILLVSYTYPPEIF